MGEKTKSEFHFTPSSGDKNGARRQRKSKAGSAPKSPRVTVKTKVKVKIEPR